MGHKRAKGHGACGGAGTAAAMGAFRARAWALTLGLVLAPIFGTHEASALTKVQCLEAHEKGQLARKAGALREAHRLFNQCADSTCPDRLRRDCGGWVSDVETSLPTVVLVVHDASGSPLRQVSLEVNGASFEMPSDGRALAVDPGELRLTVLHIPSGTRKDKRVTVYEGQKNVPVVIVFETIGRPAASATPSASVSIPTPSTATAPSTSASVPASLPTAPATRRPFPVAPIVFASVAGLSFASFAIFAIRGKSEESDLRRTCAPACSDREMRPLVTQYALADVSLGIGLVSLGLATYFFFTRPAEAAKPPPGLSWNVAPSKDGVSAGVHGRF